MASGDQAAAAGQAQAASDRLTQQQIQEAGQARDRANTYQQPYYNQGNAANNTLGYGLGTSNTINTPTDTSYNAYRVTQTTNKQAVQSQLAALQSTRPNPKDKKAFAAWQAQKAKLTTQQKNITANLQKSSTSTEFKAWQQRQPGNTTTQAPITDKFGSLLADSADPRTTAKYGNLIADNPEQFNFEADPGYQFRLEQGNRAIDNKLAGMGMSQSGAAVKESARYNQGEANQTYGDAWQRYLNRNDIYNQNRTFRTGQFNTDRGYTLGALQQQQGVGQNAANQISSNENIYGANVTGATANQNQYTQSNINAAGNARAAGAVGVGNAINSGVGNYLTYAGRTSGKTTPLSNAGTYKNLDSQGYMF